MGLLYLWPPERNVSEGLLYNVIVGEGHSCPGSLLHALVSSHTAHKWRHLSSVRDFTSQKVQQSRRTNKTELLRDENPHWQQINNTTQNPVFKGLRQVPPNSQRTTYNPIRSAWKYKLKQFFLTPWGLESGRLWMWRIRSVADCCFSTSGTGCPAKHRRSGLIPDHGYIIRAERKRPFRLGWAQVILTYVLLINKTVICISS